MAPDDLAQQTGERDYFCRDQGFAAYLATKFMFLGAIDTGEKMRKPLPDGRRDTIKEFQFLIPIDHNMEEEYANYTNGLDPSLVPAKVMFNKLRLMRQSCRKPIPAESLGTA